MAENKNNIPELKRKYLEYYVDLPIQRMAAAWVGRDEQTIIAWKHDDQKFQNDVEAARSAWVKKKAGQSPPAWVLERLERELFSPPKQEVKLDGEVTVALVEFIDDNKQSQSPTP